MSTPKASAAQVIEARIRRTSRVTASVLGVSLLVAPVALAFYAASGFLPENPWLRALDIPAAALTPTVRGVVFVTLLGGATPLLWGMWEARRLFLLYAGGEIFTESAANRFGRFSLSLLLTALAGPLALSVLSLWLSWLGVMTPPGLTISVSSTDIILVFLSCILRIIASALRGAARLAEENALFF